ncbi:16S rRNA (guanine(527)-N(7))-methyltransferase RsmG [Sinomonas notoginsengisoli]|uniref:16S rRNA (guanine(527)-N(7))-methyltransferase RsmG n=1 Tax=Sinomonas notoginsengisoli TaxID=1457311 RepID=UPI001F1FDB15|nr:16S rRNA (guanine(527)-N(7))-methyltransferase RsmG [Sinomonas notoginsengisoli]
MAEKSSAGPAVGAAPELAPGERAAAEQLFGDRLDVARQYVGHLATSGLERGLIGPREVPRLWSRHVLNCAVIESEFPQGAAIADVGSGAGLPGLCLAIARPDLRLTLIEPLERRVVWLEEVIADLGLTNVSVVRGRAEQMTGMIDVAFVTARAVSALSTLIPMTLPLLGGSGTLVAIKGRSAAEEVEKAGKAIRKFKGHSAEVHTVGDGLLEEPTTVVRIDVGEV